MKYTFLQYTVSLFRGKFVPWLIQNHAKTICFAFKGFTVSHISYIGPALSGSLVQGIGFEKMLIGIAIICFLYGPMLCALKDVPPKTEQEKQENSVSVFH